MKMVLTVTKNDVLTAKTLQNQYVSMENSVSGLRVCWYDVGAVSMETSYGDELLLVQEWWSVDLMMMIVAYLQMITF